MIKNESIYKVTLVDGPQTSIMPIKARDEAHAVRIAQNMGLGLVVKVEFSCEDKVTSAYERKRLEERRSP
jgi:hypothetical protein